MLAAPKLLGLEAAGRRVIVVLRNAGPVAQFTSQRRAGAQVVAEQQQVVWPYAAAQGELADRFRIPVVADVWPDRAYLVAVLVGLAGDRPFSLDGGGLVPSAAEAALIGDYLAFKRSSYRPAWVARMLAEPFDVDESFACLLLVKRGERDWCYRRTSWTEGPFFSPSVDAPVKLDLAQLLDRIEVTGSSWRQWKADRDGGDRS